MGTYSCDTTYQVLFFLKIIHNKVRSTGIQGVLLNIILTMIEISPYKETN